MKPCPFCAEQIQDEAVKCRHCGEALDTAAAKWRLYRKKFEAMPSDERALEWKRLTPSQQQLLTKGGPVTIPAAVATPAKSSAAQGTQNKDVSTPAAIAGAKSQHAVLASGLRLTVGLAIVAVGFAATFLLELTGVLIIVGGMLMVLQISLIKRAAVAVLVAAVMAAPSAGRNAARTPTPMASSPTGLSTPKELPPATSTPTTKEFSFVTQGGQEVIATTNAAADASDKHTVVFTPFLEKTDGNLYLAALQSLWNVYGKQRGLFQLQDAQTRENASLGGNAICWRISNPDAEYCIFPTKDSESGRIAALTVWVQ